MQIEKVHLNRRKTLPKNYHCSCPFCKKFMGVLIRPDGIKYSKLERRKYYCAEAEKAHIAKTPLHVARWVIQEYSQPRDWVLDPTIGIGTTAVEAIVQNRNTAGVEIEYAEQTRQNVSFVHGNIKSKREFRIVDGDARDIKKYFRRKFDLVINNPPYSGDERQRIYGKPGNAYYDRDKQNLAFLKESEEYWDQIAGIYKDCGDLLKPGGRFVIGVKDMIRQKAPYLIHKHYGEILHKLFDFEGMALLPHHPPTMFMSTYNKRFPKLKIKVPRYQTILIFRKS